MNVPTADTMMSGRPERPIKCMGYEEAAVEKKDDKRSYTNRTKEMCI